MDYIDKIIHKQLNALKHKSLIQEMAIKGKQMSDKYAEVLGAIVDNLVCICLYPKNKAIKHWKERAYGLCKRFVDVNIDPKPKNNPQYRYKCLYNGVVLELDDDFGALINHFKTVSEYYANRQNKKEQIFPYKPYEEAYEENKDRVKNAIIAITKFIAEQNYKELVQFVTNF